MTALSKQDVNASLLDLRTSKAFLSLIEVVTVAAAGTTEADATPLTGSTNVVTASDGARGVILPRGKRDTSVRVINSVSGSALLVYPDTGGQINALTATTGAFTVPGSNEATFVCDADLHWYVAGGATESFTDLTVTNPIVYGSGTTISANAAGNQASATALTKEFNNITTVGGAGYSVKLPTAATGLSITVKNSGANSLAVFPFSGDSINALAVDLSVNIPVSGELTFRAISTTVWETNEVLVLNAPTTETGELVIKASDNAADYAVTVTNASHGQATSHVIPDGGAATDYFVKSTAAVTLAEADVLDGPSAGVAMANKAAVLGANKNLDEFHTAALYLGAAAGTLVASTAAQIDAAVAGTPLVYRTTVLAAAINTGTASYVVPAVAGKRFQVMHISMAATLGGGNVAGPTTVEVIEETAGTVFLSHVTADLTDGVWHNLVTGTPVITGMTAGGMTSTDNKGLLVTCTGGTPYATSTGLDVVVVGYYTTT